MNAVKEEYYLVIDSMLHTVILRKFYANVYPPNCPVMKREHPKTVSWPDHPVKALPAVGRLWCSPIKNCSKDWIITLSGIRQMSILNT